MIQKVRSKIRKSLNRFHFFKKSIQKVNHSFYFQIHLSVLIDNTKMKSHCDRKYQQK